MPLQLNGFQAWIAVNGVELTQYRPTVSEDGMVATCWIPSEVGKNFVVSWRDLAPVRTYLTAGQISLDGVEVGAKFIVPSAIPNAKSEVHACNILTSETTARTFQFGLLESTDDDAYLASSTSSCLGEISIDIWNALVGAPTPVLTKDIPDEIIHERAKKTMVHKIKLGDEREVPQSKIVKTIKLKHRVQFIFRYQSLDILQAKGIAPLNNRPRQKRRATAMLEPNASPEVDTKVEDSDEEELKRLKNEVLTLETRLAKKGKSHTNKNKRVKVEHQTSFFHGQVIDLT